MICAIEWNILPLAEWEKLYAQCPRANLLQSYNYAQAASSIYGLKPRWGLIKIDNITAGLVQIFEGGIFKNIFHVVVLDCGPLWLPGFGTPGHCRTFLETFNQEFPRRPGRRRRIIANTPADSDSVPGGHYKRLNRPGYQTIWLDLRRDEARLLADLEGNWRNKLRKAQRTGMHIEWDMKGDHFPWLLHTYLADKNQRDYQGPSARLLKAMARYFAPAGRMIIGRALQNGQVVAACLILRHGSAATYQIGWSNSKGRENAAPTLLLWESALMMRAQGVYDLDLGGVNDGSANKVKSFKEGTGGDLVTLAGHYT